jgi:hypothetical protein
MAGQLASLRCLRLVALQGGDSSLAWSCAEQSLALARDVDDGWGMAEAQNLLSSIARQRGELTTARILAEASLAVATQIGDPATMAVALLSCGAVDCLQERTASACMKYAESLQLFHELGEKAGVASALEGLAVVSAAGAEWAATLRLAGAGGNDRRQSNARSSGHRFVRVRAWARRRRCWPGTQDG